MTRAAERNARESKPIRSLVEATNCKYCNGGVYLAICRDGKWRTFERDLMPAAPTNVWAWRKRQGMEETDTVPGYRLHYCAEYSHIKSGFEKITNRKAAL